MATILHVTQPTEAGVAAYVTALCRDQMRRGWNVVVACPDDGRIVGDLDSAGVPRMTWDATRSPGARSAPEAMRLVRLLDRVGPDVLHLHSSKAGLAGRLAARGRLPTLFQPHGWSWLAASRGTVRATLTWERLAARWTTLYVCVGEGEAQLGDQCGMHGRYAIVPNGVDLEHFQPAEEHDRRDAREILDVPGQAPLAVCVGRVTKQKGQDTLLAAWPAIRAQRPDALLAIVGAGELREPLRRDAPAGVVFAGPADDPWPWYAAADVVVLPSRWEGLSLTLLEALAVGRSVVASDIPGIAEALPADAGRRVPAGDATALAEAVAYRLTRPDAARAEGAVGARYATAEADLRRTHDAMASLTAHVAGWSG